MVFERFGAERTSYVTVNIEVGESVGGLVNWRSKSSEILFLEAREGEGVGSDGDRDQ